MFSTMSALAKPPSRWIYYAFVFLGLGTLLPWNFFITADSYWQYKFRNTTEIFYLKNEQTSLQKLYAPMQVILSNVINFIFLFLNALWSGVSSSRNRILRSMASIIIFFSITTVFVKVDSDDWQTIFFVITMIVIVGIIASAAMFQGSLFGVCGMLPEKYMCGVILGQSIGGIFASSARIISLVLGADEMSCAFIYFLIAVAIMMGTLAIFKYVSSTAFYMEQTKIPGNEKGELIQEKKLISMLADHGSIFKDIWPLALSVCSVFIVTLSVFPVMCVRVKSVSSNNVWANKYFQPVTTFLLFNICDFLGRKFAELLMWPRRGDRLLYLLCFIRVLCIPFILVCNHDERSYIPTYFHNDVAYVIIITIFGLSSGYLSTLSMVYAPKMVSKEKAEKASGMMAAMLGLGLLIGSGLSFAFGLIP